MPTLSPREKFLKLYANLPLNLRKETIVVLDKHGPISWNVAYLEVVNSTVLGTRILDKLSKMKII